MERDQLTKKERRAMKRGERETAQRRTGRRRTAKSAVFLIAVLLALGGGIWALVQSAGNTPPAAEGDVISKGGFHWHPELSISIKGEKQEIPANIGIGVVHQELHTHDASGVIHMEMKGLVMKDETTLGAFFKSWGEQFNANCIFESCNSPDGALKMLVNGEPNTKFENYAMKDADKIEIRYE